MNYYEEEDNYMADLDAAEQERIDAIAKANQELELELQTNNLSNEFETGK